MAIQTDGNIEKDPAQLEPTIATAEIDDNAVTNAKLASGVYSKITGIGTQSQALDMNSNNITGVAELNVSTDIIGGTVSGNKCGSCSLQTDGNDHALNLEENSGGENWQIGVQSDGTLAFYNSEATGSSYSVRFHDNGSIYIHSGDLSLEGNNLQKAVVGTDNQETEGALKWDSSNHKLLVYNGSAWETVTSST